MDFDRKVGGFNIDSLKEFVVEWNTKFPLDYWWRKKFNISFGSLQHKEMDFIDMRVEYEEDALVEKIREDKEKKDNLTLEDGKEIVRMSDKEIDEEYKKL